MKIIDLLNLVYEKKAPKKILYKYCEYEFDEFFSDYKNKDGLWLFQYLFKNEDCALWKEVEIIEDKPKKIELLNYSFAWNTNNIENLDKSFREFSRILVEQDDKLNEVIDTLNSLVEKSEKENEELEKVIKYYKNKSERLQNKLKQKDNAIDKYTKYLKLNIKIYENRVMEHSFDDDEIIMNCYQNALEKLQQAKGGCDEKN